MGALRRPAATGRTRVQGRAAEGVLSSHTRKRVHRKRARGTHEKLVAGTGHAACMYTQSRWFVVAFPLHLHLAEGLLLALPPKAATRRRRLARAAESGQCPHLDPGRGCPGGSAPAAARARSPWLPPSASRPAPIFFCQLSPSQLASSRQFQPPGSWAPMEATRTQPTTVDRRHVSNSNISQIRQAVGQPVLSKP